MNNLDAEIARLDEKIDELLDPEVGTLLLMIPGIGPASTTAITDEIGNSDCFDDPKSP